MYYADKNYNTAVMPYYIMESLPIWLSILPNLMFAITGSVNFAKGDVWGFNFGSDNVFDLGLT